MGTRSPGRPRSSPAVVRFEAPDGWRLAATRFDPEGPALGVVLAGHAMMANARSLDRPAGAGLASELAAAGFRVYALDVRGHGASDRGGSWTYDDIVRLELPAAIRFVSGRHPGEPLAFLGHSLCGHAGLAALARTPDLPVQAFVSLGSNVWIRRHEADPWTWRRKALTMAGTILACAAFGRLPVRLFRQGSEDEPRAYFAQMARWTRTDRWTGLDGFDYLAGLARVKSPVLAIAGSGDDLLCRPASSAAFHAHLTGTTVVHRVVEEGRPGHMDLVVRRIPSLRDEVVRWLAQKFATTKLEPSNS